MENLVIDPDAWGGFCKEFSRQHREWLASLSILDAATRKPGATRYDVSETVIARDQPFEGITLEQGEEGPGFSIVLGHAADHISHRIPDPTELCQEQSADGAHRGLHIRDGQGRTTLLRFRVAARPERVDGMAPTPA